MSPAEDRPAAGPGSSEILLEGYADPGLPPIEDLRKLHRLITAYFSWSKIPPATRSAAMPILQPP